MPTTAPSRRKSSRVRGGLDALENDTDEASLEKENSAPAGTKVASKKKKREAETTEGKKLTKKRKKEMTTDDGFQFVVRRQSSRLSNRTSQENATATATATTQTAPPPAKPTQLPGDSPTPPPRVVKKKKWDEETSREVEEREVVASTTKTRAGRSGKGKPRQRADDVRVMESSTVPSTANDSNSRIPRISDVSKIMLPTSDTPIQRKNQQFRKGSGERRRSSLGQRGRRASSMMQNGLIAEPHSEISHTEFYKHIDEEQMENARMKQLLAWCGTRGLDRLKQAAPPGSNSSDVEGSARHIARMMAEDLLKDITVNGELSTWFTRAASPAPAPIKKPNPKNIQNQKEQERLKAHLEQLNREHQSWLSLLSLKPNISLEEPNNPPDLLRPKEAEFKASEADHQEVITQARRLVKHQAAEIEFSMDRLADGVHKLRAYGDAASELAEKVLETAGNAVEEGDARLRVGTGTDALSLQEVLRSISYTNPSLSTA